jgi:uncharacterized protein
MSNVIQQIERYVVRSMRSVTEPDLRIGHGFDHVDRVRGWAVRIARGEGIDDLAPIEAAALLHDIGLTKVAADERGRHGEVGAVIAARYLRTHEHFDRETCARIIEAIRFHNAPSGGGVLGAILRDADKLDALGAVGIMRAFTSKYALPPYDPRHIKGATWGLPMSGFEARFAAGEGIGTTIIDQVNFQISFYGDLHTKTARRLGEPRVALMRAFVIELESEVNAAQAAGGYHPSRSPYGEP